MGATPTAVSIVNTKTAKLVEVTETTVKGLYIELSGSKGMFSLNLSKKGNKDVKPITQEHWLYTEELDALIAVLSEFKKVLNEDSTNGQ